MPKDPPEIIDLDTKAKEQLEQRVLESSLCSEDAKTLVSVRLPGDGSDLPTVLELHSAQGRRTGLVTIRDSVLHATPASRNMPHISPVSQPRNSGIATLVAITSAQ